MAVVQSQYAQITDLTALAITQAQASRYGVVAMSASLQAASSIADTYLPSQFTLPLQTSPQGWDMSLTLNVCNVAAWLLANQFGFNPGAPGDDLVVKRYSASIDWFKQIRDKEIFPQWLDSSGVNPATTEAGDFIVSDPPVGFTTRGVQPGTTPTTADPYTNFFGDRS